MLVSVNGYVFETRDIMKIRPVALGYDFPGNCRWVMAVEFYNREFFSFHSREQEEVERVREVLASRPVEVRERAEAELLPKCKERARLDLEQVYEFLVGHKFSDSVSRDFEPTELPSMQIGKTDWNDLKRVDEIEAKWKGEQDIYVTNAGNEVAPKRGAWQRALRSFLTGGASDTGPK